MCYMLLFGCLPQLKYDRWYISVKIYHILYRIYITNDISLKEIYNRCQFTIEKE